MAKMSDIVPQPNLIKDECDLCQCHEKAYSKLPERILCPNCNNKIEFGYAVNHEHFTVVGRTNSYNSEDEIIKTYVEQCDCGEYVALIPKTIIYNGNHDTYYTGAGDYLVNDKEVFDDAENKIKQHIDQFLKRRENGENLQPFILALWIRRDITQSISEYLHKQKGGLF